MPRKARLDVPGFLYHISAYGINGQSIFLTDDDYLDFLKRFSALLEETQTICYSWTLLPNHFHFLIRPEYTSIKKIMRKLMIGYSVTFNKRHNRTGHIFHGRYKSIIIQEAPYVKDLICYIHLNPIRSKLVQNLFLLQTYPWTGHHEILNQKPPQSVPQLFSDHMIQEIYSYFGQTHTEAINSYMIFMNKGVSIGHRNIFKGGGWLRSTGMTKNEVWIVDSSDKTNYDERILGDKSFVHEVLSIAKAQQSVQKQHVPINELIVKVCDFYQVNIEELLRGSQKSQISKARCVICFIEMNMMKRSGVIVGKMLRVSGYSAIRCAEKGENIFQNDPMLKQIVQSLIIPENQNDVLTDCKTNF